jgi:hypothetical protein
VAFTTAATTAIGTSGATIPLLNGNNTYSGISNFTGTFQVNANAMTFPTSSATITQTIASGQATLNTTAITNGTCSAVQTFTATNVAVSDAISVSFNGTTDPTTITGYTPGTMLSILHFPTAGNVNFKVCNNTSAPITPAAVTLNWRVMR